MFIWAARSHLLCDAKPIFRFEANPDLSAEVSADLSNRVFPCLFGLARR
jgi:hypothetical protein